MNRFWHLINTTIGRKLLVATSGIVLVLFLLGHLMGNLTIYLGSDALNAYAHWLQSSPVLWLVRAIMLAVVLIHVVLALRVFRENLAARTQPYQHHDSRWLWLFRKRMIISGMVVLVFIIGHILHLTGGVGIEQLFRLVDARGHADVYNRVVGSFQSPWLASSYVVAMLFVSVHLKHSVRALFQTLGVYHENFFGFFELLSWVVAIVIGAGLVSIPLAVQLNLLQPESTALSVFIGERIGVGA
ncbi:MAG: succinate dehydrogenase cytochrome b subunit [Pseudomonadota bacterium]